MDFDAVDNFENVEMTYVSFLSRGYISRNKNIFEEIRLTDFSRFVLYSCVYGTPIFKMGNKGKKILILSGIHGNELPPQLANLTLLNELIDKKINNTIYFIPFASPKSTMNNERTFNSLDLNRAAHITNSLSNQIVRSIEELKIDFVGDFHSTAYNSNPGCESVFSSKNPSPESFLIARYISQNVGSEIITYDIAGSQYKGAVEDVCNLRGTPAVTCEVLSPFASIGKGSFEKSLEQMKSFLAYFGF
ncbi:MAG: succinylglutamate desuccinylase/aspartoacylase family protein [Methanobrevibacter sp.]|uniref:succinylglutamate desuccinylase/aspartoacylase domain-containing protein n=1 Tax=Methanobrevibacter sp. TaxID=66852 RepID=UPI0025FA9626|nr:succinylglutamate desuccinylase/aspartoacylase family protein [Methanobrevibacter sp.]MBR0271953.1 succinylglutamate desuccinylase/aspartoacylase family protein [Methanobrevibacter sp.]